MEEETYLNSVDKVQQDLALVTRTDILDVLDNELSGGAHAADCQEDIVVEEVSSQALNLLGEGGAEQQCLALP